MENKTDLVEFTQPQIDLIRDTIARNATPDEMKLFLYRAKAMGLDPLKPGQIHFVKYGSGPGTIVVGIEGFRVIAHRTNKIAGINRGALRDKDGKLTGAWCEVYRTDWAKPAREEVPLIEYNTHKGPWLKMPETMIKKVAEAAALRMAFPECLGGVYTAEEMAQAARGPVAPEAPAEGDGYQVPDRDYVIPYGRLAQKRPEDCDVRVLREEVEKVEKKYKGKELPMRAQEFVDICSKVIADWETKKDPTSFENAP